MPTKDGYDQEFVSRIDLINGSRARYIMSVPF